jgi:hypothetical protein
MEAGGAAAPLTVATPVSMISFDTYNTATGIAAATARDSNPNETSKGPAFHPIFRTGGMFRGLLRAAAVVAQQ